MPTSQACDPAASWSLLVVGLDRHHLVAERRGGWHDCETIKMHELDNLASAIQSVRDSWAKMTPFASEAATLFYQNLFALDPTLRHLFKGDMREQGTRLMAMMNVVVGKLDDSDELMPLLGQLGQRHADYGVTPEHYRLVGTALLQTLEQALGAGCTPVVKSAWTIVYDLISRRMQAADARSPAAPDSARSAAQ
jgi:hemoglobin-like flavoprotein